MESKELRDAAKTLVTQAEKAIENGDAEQCEKLIAEATENISKADALDTAKSNVKHLTDMWGEDMVQKIPVASEDVKVYNPDDSTRKIKANYKPATWIKGLPAAAQPLWTQEQMGDNLKDEAKIQTDAFLTWMQAPSEDYFWKNANPDFIKAMQEDSDAEGGYFVPELFLNNTIHDEGVPTGMIRGACTSIRVSSKDGYMPTLGSADWGEIAEEASYTTQESTPTIGQVTFAIKKSGGMIRTSRELLDDSAVNLPSLLAQIFAEAAGQFEDKGILNGNGTVNHTGIIQGGSADYLTASNTALAAADIFGIFYTLNAQFRGNATWVIPSIISKEINSINATSAGVHSVNDLNTPPASFLLGRPVINNDVTGNGMGSGMVASSDIGIFGDFRNYYLFDRMGFTVIRNDSLYMQNDQVGFFGTRRGDGKPGLTDAFKVLKCAA